MNLIVAQLMGGLGNQMFQYACARRLAYALRAPLKLDLSALEIGLRSYALDALRISAEIATTEEVSAFRRRAYVHRILPYPLFKRLKYQVIKERSFAFSPLVLEPGSNVLLEGYWQSARYFDDIADIIRQEFEPKTVGEAGASITARIAATNAVSIHVRRGDYVSNAEINRVHGTCGLDYYERAVGEIARLQPNPHFFVFSDDPAWVKHNLRLQFPIEIVERTDTASDGEALHLMTLCRHNIIANSSFSWWAAWLNRHTNKRVIAPRKWFNSGIHDTRDLIPADWLRI